MRGFDDVGVLRLQHLLHFADCFNVYSVIGRGRASDSMDEIAVSLDDCVCLCECWLR